MAAVNQGDLESCFKPRLVAQIFSDDGTATLGPRLKVALETGSAQAQAILAKVAAWADDDTFQTLVDEDEAIKYAVCQLVMAVGADASPEWFGGDQSQPAAWRSSARQTLNDFVSTKTRSKAEPVAGKNTVNQPRVANAKQFEFAGRRGNGPSGAY